MAAEIPIDMAHPAEAHAPISIFCSSAPEDRNLKDAMLKNFKPLELTGLIRIVDQQALLAGDETKNKLVDHLESTKIILLLVSPEFFDDKICLDLVLPQAFMKHKKGEVRLLPVMLKSLPIKTLPSTDIPILHSDEPIASWRKRDEAFTSVAQEVNNVVAKIRAGRVVESPSAGGGRSALKSSLLVAHLCDRIEQTKDLGRALRAQERAMKANRRLVPLVCFVHGKADEDLEGYKQRLKVHDIYELLGIDRIRVPVKELILQWPFEQKARRKPLRYFSEKLAEAETGKAKTDMKEVVGRLAQFGAPVMVSTYLSTDEWDNSTPSLIKSYLSFWNDLPEVASQTPLVVSFFISYESAASDDPTVRATYEQRNLEARAFLRGLEFNHYPKLRGVVLDELPPVKQSEVLGWIDDYKLFAEFCALHGPRFCNPSEIIRMKNAIKKLYNSARWQAVGSPPAIPMQALAEQLSEFLDRHRCEAGRH